MEGGHTRRLPAWMLAAENPKIENEAEEDRRDANINNNIDDDNNDNENDAGNQKNKKEKKRNRNRNRNSDKSSTRKKRVEEASTKKRKRTGTRTEAQQEEEEEEELTVEDLLSIAKECVRDGEDSSEQKQALDRDCRSVRELPTKAASGNDLERSHVAIDCELQPSSAASTTALAGQRSLITASRTGDPAQDMLNLFLGPWLKPPEEEKNAGTVTKNVDFLVYDLEKQRQNHVVGEENAPPVKKKTSFKDKVSMLLN